jgi:type III secretory pathway component EscS
MIAPSLGLVSALTALFASVAGPFVTLYVARTQLKASVRSTNRQRWIDEFRELIAHFCSELAVAAQSRDKIVSGGRIVIHDAPDFLNAFGRLIYTANKIRLMVNPLEPDHQRLLKLLNGMLVRLKTAPDGNDLQDEGLQMVDQVIAVSLTIVRCEWLRVQKGN